MMDNQKKLPLPRQTVSSRAIKMAADLQVQRFIKYANIAFFHSYAELLFAALLESKLDVSYFCPQPKGVWVGRKFYTPDFYYVDGRRRIYAEIKPEGKMDEGLKTKFSEIAKFNGCEFKVVSNESILEQETKANNWLHIVRAINSGALISTTQIEEKLLIDISINGGCPLGDIVSPENRFNNQTYELAIFRLVHSGQLRIDDSEELSFVTPIMA